jgi:antitoxin CcdA
MRMAKRRSPGKPAGVAEGTAAFQPPKTMAERARQRENGPKRAVNLTASAHCLSEAKAMGLNLSEIFDTALREAVRSQIKRELAEFADWHNKHIEEHGLWSDRVRLFR